VVKTASIIFPGISSNVSNRPKQVAPATMIKRVAEVTAELTVIFLTSMNFMDLWINSSTINAYTEATTAASLAVKAPENMPPNMITGSIRAQNPSLSTANTSMGLGTGIRTISVFFRKKK